MCDKISIKMNSASRLWIHDLSGDGVNDWNITIEWIFDFQCNFIYVLYRVNYKFSEKNVYWKVNL